jgi:2-keto-4-pentenoate hydratase
MTQDIDAQRRIEDIARRLIDARRTRTRISLADSMPADAAEAYAVQDLVAQSLGPIGGWKVGAKGPDAEPTCAPLAAAGILPTPASLADGAWRARGIETELAVRFEADLPERDTPYTGDEVLAAIGAVLPTIEVVETRLLEFPRAQPLAMLADMGAHGALIIGSAIPFDPALFDSRKLAARQWFGNEEVANSTGGNPAIDIGRLLTWLANHCAARGLGLARGQVVTTGSCTGMLFAPAGAQVRGHVAGLGECALHFTG